jgi:hypothetical protein
MIPFDMVRLDSNVTTQDGQRRKPAMDRILDLAKVSMMLTRKYDENCKNCMMYTNVSGFSPTCLWINEIQNGTYQKDK